MAQNKRKGKTRPKGRVKIEGLRRQNRRVTRVILHIHYLGMTCFGGVPVFSIGLMVFRVSVLAPFVNCFRMFGNIGSSL